MCQLGKWHIAWSGISRCSTISIWKEDNPSSPHTNHPTQTMKKLLSLSLLALLGLSTVAAFAPDADASCRCRMLRSGRVVCSGC